MSIEEYIVVSDKFEPTESLVGFDFPCCACKHQYKDQFSEPCNSCGHNLNADIRPSESKSGAA